MKTNCSFPGGEGGPGQEPGRKWGPRSHSHKEINSAPRELSLPAWRAPRRAWKQPGRHLDAGPWDSDWRTQVPRAQTSDPRAA